MVTVLIYCLLLYAIGFALVRYVGGTVLRHDMSWLLLALILGLTASAIVHPNLLLLSGLYGCALFIGVRNRLDLACRYILLSFLTIPLATTLSVGPLYLLQLSSQQVLTFALVLGIAVFPERRTIELKNNPLGLVLSLLLVLIIGVMSDRVWTTTNILRNVFTTTISFILPLIILRRCINQEKDIGRILACLMGAAIVLVPMALFEARMSFAPVDTVSQLLGTDNSFAKSSYMRGGVLRASTVFSTVLAYAYFMMIALAVVLASREKFRSAFHWRVAAAMVALGLLLAQSRGAWLGLIAIAIAFYALRGQFGRLAAVAGGALMVFSLLLAASGISSKVAAFLGTDASANGHITDYRQALFSRGMEEGMKAPVFGQDLAVVTSKMPDLRQGEGIVDFVNTYLAFFLGAGLVGLVPFVILQFGLVLSLALAARKRSSSQTLRRSQILVGAVFCGAMSLLFFCSFIERIPLMYILLLACAKSRRNTDRLPKSEAHRGPRRRYLVGKAV